MSGEDELWSVSWQVSRQDKQCNNSWIFLSSILYSWFLGRMQHVCINSEPCAKLPETIHIRIFIWAEACYKNSSEQYVIGCWKSRRWGFSGQRWGSLVPAELLQLIKMTFAGSVHFLLGHLHLVKDNLTFGKSHSSGSALHNFLLRSKTTQKNTEMFNILLLVQKVKAGINKPVSP